MKHVTLELAPDAVPIPAVERVVAALVAGGTDTVAAAPQQLSRRPSAEGVAGCR